MLTPTIGPRLIVLVVLVALVSAMGSAWAQGTAAAKAAESATKACSAGNRQAVAELAQALDAANKRNRLNPVMMSRLSGFESSLATLKGVTLRDSRSARDCEQVSQAIEAEQERLERLIGPDPQVIECIAANQQLYGQAVQALADLPDATRSQAPAQALQTRLTELKPTVAREGQSLTECKQTGAAVSHEQTQVAALVASAPRPTPDGAAINACRASNIDAYGEALRGWRDWASILGVTAGAAQYDAAMLRLRRLRDEVARPAGTLADCEALTRAIAQERALAPRGQGAPAGAAAPTPGAASPAPSPAASPGASVVAAPAAAPAAAAAAPAASAANASCLVVHGESYNALVQQFTRQLRVGDTADEARQRLQGLSERLAAVHVILASDAPGTDCAAVGRVLTGIAADLK